MHDITIKELKEICAYGTTIKIKFADNGKTVIDDVASLERSKDKRQMAKWEAFKDMPVYYVRPTIDIADAKRAIGDCFRMKIEASISRLYYDEAMRKIK